MVAATLERKDLVTGHIRHVERDCVTLWPLWIPSLLCSLLEADYRQLATFVPQDHYPALMQLNILSTWDVICALGNLSFHFQS